ncbi:hypothetical protein DYI37_14710 [Fulvimarina endophytica]|uniref:DUF3253 domain-containing protein n=1 Tax=Fulvimarina endophytica TaxID=2293836 RepID=A0A371WZU2_9HYPH|nr:hypothetical protein [Fulvimarina endophytica]RFC62511.1 hypothetical protein DYI37_14710 [Fulvimarina endophytica]
MDKPLELNAAEAVLLDRLFREGPVRTETPASARDLVEKDLARWADHQGLLEITELGRRSACVYKLV